MACKAMAAPLCSEPGGSVGHGGFGRVRWWCYVVKEVDYELQSWAREQIWSAERTPVPVEERSQVRRACRRFRWSHTSACRCSQGADGNRQVALAGLRLPPAHGWDPSCRPAAPEQQALM